MVLNIEPIACPRPRVSRFGTYYPPKYANWKKQASFLLAKMQPSQNLYMEFIIKRPKRLKKGKRVLHTKKPDIDNLIQAIFHALPFDDACIHTITASKWYASSDEAPHILIVGAHHNE